MADGKWEVSEGALDDVLASYSRVEPPPFFEEKLLWRVRQEPARRSWLSSAALIGAAAIAAAILVATLPVIQTIKRPTPRIDEMANAKPPNSLSPVPSVASSGRSPVFVARPAGKHRRPALVKREKFPSPAPLTDEERALRLLSVGRGGKPDVLLDRDNLAVNPVEIQKIEVQPLAIGS